MFLEFVKIRKIFDKNSQHIYIYIVNNLIFFVDRIIFKD